ncbi:MAG: hypothetical protein U1D30_17080 [Planctomycetota bacterium]
MGDVGPSTANEAIAKPTVESPLLRAGLFVLLFSLVAIAQWPAWKYPPYVEQCGIWIEASWLAAHDFDYQSLLYEQRHGEDGGPRIYFCTALPGVIALGMQWLPTPFATIVAYRVFNALCVALILFVVYELTARRGAWFQGVFSAVAVLTFPLFRVQAEMLGLDIPMTAAAMLWWHALARRRYRLNLLWAIVAFLAKPSAFVLPFANASYAILAIMRCRSDLPRVRSLAGWALVNVCLFLAEIGILVFSGNLRGRMVPFADFILWFLSCPDLLILLFIAFCLFWRGRRLPVETPPMLTTSEEFSRVGWAVVLWTLAAAFVTHFESRHLTLCIPFLVVLFANTLRTYRGVACSPMIVLLIAVNLTNSFGDFFPKMDVSVVRGFGIPERSLEYRADIQSLMNACRVLERECGSDAILGLDQFTYMPKLPSLGYVTDSRVLGEERFEQVSDSVDEQVFRLLDDAPSSVVVTYVMSQLGAWPFPAYAIEPPTEPGDQVLYHDHLNPPIVIYRRDFSKLETLPERYRAYLDLMFSDAKDIDPGARLAILGSERRARTYVAAELGVAITDPLVQEELVRRVEDLHEKWKKEVRAGFFVAERRERVARECLERLKIGRQLNTPSWTDRTLLETSIQRVYYYSPSARRAD